MKKDIKVDLLECRGCGAIIYDCFDFDTGEAYGSGPVCVCGFSPGRHWYLKLDLVDYGVLGVIDEKVL